MASKTAACTMAMSRVWWLLSRSANTVLTAIAFQSVTTSALAIRGRRRRVAVLAPTAMNAATHCRIPDVESARIVACISNSLAPPLVEPHQLAPESFYRLTREIRGNLLTVNERGRIRRRRRPWTGQTTGASCGVFRSEEHTSELQSLRHLVCRLLLEKKK